MISIRTDVEVASLNPSSSPDELARLLTLLCGQKVDLIALSDDAKEEIRSLLPQLQRAQLGYAQFNELLLLFNQERVQLPFFRFFFWSRTLAPP
jgi:hypothetical protein